jgi:transposase
MYKVIGIDISKASFDVSYEKTEGRFYHSKFDNNARGFTKFRNIIDTMDHCIMEATGPYYLKLACYLYTRGFKVSVVNPLQIKHFVRMRMTKAKTDKKDSAMIALYGQSEKPVLWEPVQTHIMQLQQILTAIEGLQKQSTMLNNQIEAFAQLPVKEKSVISTHKSLLRTIKTKIAKLEDKMVEVVKNHYIDTFTSLKTIPGIGPKTAIILIVITNNFKKFDDIKKLSAYVGLSPRVYQSGSSINGKGHITKMGNKYVRKLLYLCTWTAKTHNAHCKKMYDRLKEKQKPERVIKIAMANKLLRQAFAIGSSLGVYDKNYEYKFDS